MRAFALTLSETPERTAKAKAHFDEHGVKAQFINGIHAEKFGLLTTHAYEVDHPGSGYRIPPKHVGMCLSHYIAWTVCSFFSDESFLILEDDAQFAPDWKSRYHAAMAHLPQDWDLFYIGSCNCELSQKDHIGGEVFKVVNPMCTHAILIRNKAIPVLLETQRKIWAPIDLSLIFRSLPKLKTYCLLPRIVSQFDTVIQP